MNKELEKLVSFLLHSRTQIHIYHLQTTSFAEHLALGGYYDDIVGLVDGLVESYQGKYDIIKSYDSFELDAYKGGEQAITFLKALGKKVEGVQASTKDTYIQNQLDTITELIYSTIYKLRFLK